LSEVIEAQARPRGKEAALSGGLCLGQYSSASMIVRTRVVLVGSAGSSEPKITAEQKKEIVEAVSSGRKTPAEIARLLKIHRATVSRIVSQARAGV
jgi:DNA invertase Pin-like site-specific DNA recombinase